MSMKVSNAYRVKDRDRLWPVLREIRERGQKEVVARLRAYYIEEMETVDRASEVYTSARAEDPQKGEVPLRLSIARDKLREGFEKSVLTMRRDYFDPDVTVTVTEHPTGFYLRAFCDPVSVLAGSLDFLKTHPELEDFHYQNSTDGPHDVSPEAWQARRRIWDEMSTPPDSGHFKDQLLLEISSWGAFWYLDPWSHVLRELRESPPTLPTREEVLARKLRRLPAFKEVVAEPGHITAVTTEGTSVVVRRPKHRSQKKRWVSEMDGKLKVHRSLDRAVDWVYLQMNPGLRETVERWRRDARDRRKEAKAREAAGA